jgi:endogenous inhibitor of DNA gyrase (YacG/DUF329 family)
VRSCGKPLPELAILEGDPYCSARCCRLEHGISLASEVEEDARLAVKAAALQLERRRQLRKSRKDSRL